MEFFLFMVKTMLGVGWSFILWSMLFLEGWSSRSSYFIGVALELVISNFYHFKIVLVFSSHENIIYRSL